MTLQPSRLLIHRTPVGILSLVPKLVFHLKVFSYVETITTEIQDFQTYHTQLMSPTKIHHNRPDQSKRSALQHGFSPQKI